MDTLLINRSQDVKVFVNPSDRKLWIESVYNFDISIFDINGRQMLNQSNVNENIDISFLKQRVYIIQKKSGNNFIIEKL